MPEQMGFELTKRCFQAGSCLSHSAARRLMPPGAVLLTSRCAPMVDCPFTQILRTLCAYDEGTRLLPVLHANTLPSRSTPAHLHETTHTAELRFMDIDDLVQLKIADRLAPVGCEGIPGRVQPGVVGAAVMYIEAALLKPKFVAAQQGVRL